MRFYFLLTLSSHVHFLERNHIYKGVFSGHLQLSLILLTVATMVDLRNQITVQRSVLDGFGEVSGEDVFLALEIGNGSGNL